MRKAFVLSCFILATLPGLVNASASYRYAYISYVDGELSIQRAAEPSPELGAHNEPVMPGDRIWTHGSSFAEVRLGESSVLRLSEDTKVDFVDLDSGTILRVWSGSVILKLGEDRDDVRIDSPAGSVRPTTEGLYRIDVRNGDRLTLTVSRGAAELLSSVASVVVRSGETSGVLSGQAPEDPRPFNTASLDSLDEWSERRDRTASTVRDVSVDRIPREVRVYAGDLSYHGDWLADSAYGYVWYPRVSVGWVPYRDGRWCYTRYGYTWVSYEPWGWAPYHYGRWGHNHRGWYWIPGSTWGPAWVSFALGPFWVGWSPLGYHNEPVYRFHRGGHFRRGHRGHWGPLAYDDSPGWNFATRDDFPRRVARRLDPALVQASASGVRILDPGTALGRDLSPRGLAAERGESRRGGWTGPARTGIGSGASGNAFRSRALTSSTEPSRGLVERGGEPRVPRAAGDAPRERGSTERARGGRVLDTAPVLPGGTRAGRGVAVERERPSSSSVERGERGSGIVLRSRIGNGRFGASQGSSTLPRSAVRERSATRDRRETAPRPLVTERPPRGAGELSPTRRDRFGRTGGARQVERAPGRERSSRAVSPRTSAPRDGGAMRFGGARMGASPESSRARSADRSSSRASPPSRPSREAARGSSTAGASRGAGAGASRGTARSRPRRQN